MIGNSTADRDLEHPVHDSTRTIPTLNRSLTAHSSLVSSHLATTTTVFFTCSPTEQNVCRLYSMSFISNLEIDLARSTRSGTARDEALLQHDDVIAS